MCILVRGTNFVFMTFASETISGPVKVYFVKNPMFDLVKLGQTRQQKTSNENPMFENPSNVLFKMFK